MLHSHHAVAKAYWLRLTSQSAHSSHETGLQQRRAHAQLRIIRNYALMQNDIYPDCFG